MSEKGGFPARGPESNEPPPSYSPPTDAGFANTAYTAPQYAPQQYGVPTAQYGGQVPQQYGGQVPQQYGMQQQQNVNTVVVTQPGVNNQVVYGYAPDNMGLAIFVTICCCLPIGIIAIIRASEARAAVNRGDTQNAMLLSAQSKRLSMISLASGIVVIIVSIIVVAVEVASINTCYNCY